MTKKQQIIEAYEKGTKPKEIVKALDTYYSYVHGIIKDYKLQKELEALKNK